MPPIDTQSDSDTENEPPALAEAGDVVQLKSGGPSMTVTLVSGDNATTAWFDDDKRLQGGTFARKALEVQDDEPPPPRRSATAKRGKR
jgi:uncharacterized protein YodC (DUF2158 family)